MSDTGASAAQTAPAASTAPVASGASALGDSLPARRSFSAILSGFEMRIPDLWGQRYLATERRDPEEFPGAATVTEFVFLAESDPTPRPLLTLVRYQKARWDGLATRPGAVVASPGKDVIAAVFPGRNPFAAGSNDAQVFDAMRLSEAQVRNLIKVRS